MVEREVGFDDEERRVYSYTADEATSGMLARANLRLWRGSSKALFLIYGGVVLLALTKAFAGEWYWAVVLIAALPIGVGSQVWGLRKRWRSMVPPGTCLETEFGPTTMLIRTASTTAEIQLSSISEVRDVGDAVAFRVDNQGVRQMLPREIFPAAELDRVHGLVAARGR